VPQLTALAPTHLWLLARCTPSLLAFLFFLLKRQLAGASRWCFYLYQETFIPILARKARLDNAKNKMPTVYIFYHHTAPQ
jgi:hypothetical protein